MRQKQPPTPCISQKAKRLWPQSDLPDSGCRRRPSGPALAWGFLPTVLGPVSVKLGLRFPGVGSAGDVGVWLVHVREAAQVTHTPSHSAVTVPTLPHPRGDAPAALPIPLLVPSLCQAP